jgi:hypothetical protein
LVSKEIEVLQPLHPPTTADTASEARRHAYNTAFQELDLGWYWDAETFARLHPYGRAGVRSYVETSQPHLLRAYTAEFLVDLIEATQARCHERIAGAVQARIAQAHSPRLAA